MADLEYEGTKLKAFLEDSTVQAALVLMKERAYADFLSAKNDDERREAQAIAKVTDTFVVALQSVVDAGERARIERERREDAPASRPTE